MGGGPIKNINVHAMSANRSIKAFKLDLGRSGLPDLQRQSCQPQYSTITDMKNLINLPPKP